MMLHSASLRNDAGDTVLDDVHFHLTPVSGQEVNHITAMQSFWLPSCEGIYKVFPRVAFIENSHAFLCVPNSASY